MFWNDAEPGKILNVLVLKFGIYLIFFLVEGKSQGQTRKSLHLSARQKTKIRHGKVLSFNELKINVYPRFK